MRCSQKQVEELSAQLGAVMAEKSRLETKAKILDKVVVLNMHHEARLHCNKVTRRQISVND